MGLGNRIRKQSREDGGEAVRVGGGNKLHDKGLALAGKTELMGETSFRMYADIFEAGMSSFLGDNF